MSYPKLAPTPTMIRTGTGTLEEVNGAKEAPATESVAITVTIAETRRLQSMNSKEKLKTVRFPNYYLPKQSIDPLNTRRLLTLSPYYAQISSDRKQPS